MRVGAHTGAHRRRARHPGRDRRPTNSWWYRARRHLETISFPIWLAPALRRPPWPPGGYGWRRCEIARAAHGSRGSCCFSHCYSLAKRPRPCHEHVDADAVGLERKPLRIGQQGSVQLGAARATVVVPGERVP